MSEPQYFEEACYLVAQELAELVIRKQNDYGVRNILDFGELGVLIRCNDKIARLKNLILNRKEGVSEPKNDAWDDLGGYSIVMGLLRRGWFTLPLKGDVRC